MTTAKLLRIYQRPPPHPSRSSRAGSFLAIIFVIAGFLNESTHAEACETSTPPTVTVQIQSGEVREALDTTADELRHVAAVRGVQPHWPALGLYIAKIGYSADIAKNARAEEDGFYCVTPTSVQVVISLSGRVIHLARELGADHCLEEAVRQLEWHHARADDQTFMKIPTFLRTAFADFQPARAVSAEAAEALVVATVHARMEGILDQLDRYRTMLNQSIDTPAALAKLHTQCPKPMAGAGPKID